jgi:ElaB/YqjD/DUF883 family membrane-anchored ribosome-binding protein
MVSPVKELNPTSRSSGQETSADSTLAELRESVTAIAKEVATLAERRTRAARQSAVNTAEAGASELRRTIRSQPVIAIGAAAAAGAVLALLVMPRFGGRPSPKSRWDSWTPNITRADFHDFADNIQRSVSRAAQSASAPITPTLERLVDALSRTDASSSVNTIIDKASGWFQKAQDKAKEKMG